MSSSSPTSTPSTTTCPNCAAPASGRFCANCGASLEGAICGACRAPLTPGAKFCHRCGTAAGAPAAPAPRPDAGGFPAALPWAVAGIALLALIALVAGQRFNARPTRAADPVAQGPVEDGAGGAPVRGPDISALSPRERADRLYDRIMRLDSEGKKDSVEFFAQMGISAYQMLPEQDADTRYDMGRIAEAAGATPLARTQADSILASDPNHLLGLILAISVARDAGDAPAVRTLQQKLLAVQSTEIAKRLPEYQRHQGEIAVEVEAARKAK